MSDEPTASSDEALALEPATTINEPRRRALWGVLAIIALVTGGVVVASSDDSAPARLPIALGAGATGESGASPAADMKMAWVHYVAGEGLPALGDDATAYRLDGKVDEAQVRSLARALGLSSDPVRDGELWRVEADGDVLEVYPGGGGGWWYSSKSATISSVAGSSGSEGCAPDGGCATEVACAPEPCGVPAPPPKPLTNPDLPSEEQARQIALDLLGSTGVDVTTAMVTVNGPYEAWYVSVEPRIDGVLVSGASASVGVGANGTILNASGTLGTPVRLDDYPVLDTRAVIDRLNHQQGDYVLEDDALVDPATEPAPEPGLDPGVASSETCRNEADGSTVCDVVDELGPAPAPLEIALLAAEPVLVLLPAMDGSKASYLVPGYRMTDDNGGVVDVVAVDDDSLAPSQAPSPQVVDPPMSVEEAPYGREPDAAPEIGTATPRR